MSILRVVQDPTVDSKYFAPGFSVCADGIVRGGLPTVHCSSDPVHLLSESPCRPIAHTQTMPMHSSATFRVRGEKATGDQQYVAWKVGPVAAYAVEDTGLIGVGWRADVSTSVRGANHATCGARDAAPNPAAGATALDARTTSGEIAVERRKRRWAATAIWGMLCLVVLLESGSVVLGVLRVVVSELGHSLLTAQAHAAVKHCAQNPGWCR
jgi:hypothetical protein